MVITDRRDILPQPGTDLKNRINQGIVLLKGGESVKAFDFYRDSARARQAGISLTIDSSVPVDFSKPISGGTIKELADSFDLKSYAHANNIFLAKFIPVRLLSFRKQLPPELVQEATLVCVDVWLQALQHISDTSLTGYVDPYIDTAAYMEQQGLTLSDIFLQRHDRKSVLDGSDTMPYAKSLKRGSYIKIVRASGQEETDWQITASRPQSRVATVRRNDLHKEISTAELIMTNSAPVTPPFEHLASFQDVYQKLTELGGIQGSDGYYDSLTLKRIIGSVRSGNAPVDGITAAGGLRAVIRKLLNP